MENADRALAGRYRLIRPLGAGGMGRVWLAFDPVLECDVAVKEVIVPVTATDEEQRERFARARREARHAAVLRDHPHVITVLDVFDEDGRPWIVMEHVPSRSLADVVSTSGPLPVGEVARIAEALLDGLGAAHRREVLHRDVKPANVLLGDDGRIVLTDFGIAVREKDLSLTASGSVVGSPAFMAPERAHDQDATAASDMFSAGATLYYAAEGRSPFERSTAAATLTAVLFDDPPMPSRAGVLAPLIVALLAKDPAQRPDTQEARQRLAEIQKDKDNADGAVPADKRRDDVSGPTLVPALPATQTSATETTSGSTTTRLDRPEPARTAPLAAATASVTAPHPRPVTSAVKPVRSKRRSRMYLAVGVATVVVTVGVFAAVGWPVPATTPPVGMSSASVGVTPAAVAAAGPSTVPRQTLALSTSPAPAVGASDSTADPVSVVKAYFAAISARDYSRAWALGGKNLNAGRSYTQWVIGLAGVSSYTVDVTAVSGGTVSLELIAQHTDQSSQFFSGTLTVEAGVITGGDMHDMASGQTPDSVILYACGGVPVVRPTTYMLSCSSGNYLLKDMTWTDWSPTMATGSAMLSSNNCSPDCAEGTYVAMPLS